MRRNGRVVIFAALVACATAGPIARAGTSFTSVTTGTNGSGNPTDNSWDTTNNVLLSSTGPDPDGAGPLARPLTSYRYDESQIGTACTPNDGACGQSYPLQSLRCSQIESAVRSARAPMVEVGLTAALVVKQLPSAMKRFLTSWA